MEFIWFSAQDEPMKHAYALREEVFVKEQGFSLEDDRDAADAQAMHVVGYEQGEPVCTARMFVQEPGVYHAGRIAVRAARRSRGFGRALMEELVRKAASLGAKRLELGAQIDKAGFYEAVGFSRFGEPFFDAGYPHIGMRKEL